VLIVLFECAVSDHVSSIFHLVMCVK